MAGEELYIDESDVLFRELEKAWVLLYLVDNCGEIYFDRLFIKTIKRLFPGIEVYVAAKEG